MDALFRFRAWIVMGVALLAVMLATVLGTGAKRGSGGAAAAGQPRVSFGAGVQTPGASGRLLYTNGWETTTGRETIGVYAGAQTSNRENGLFVILRRGGGVRAQRLREVVVRGSGAVTLLRPATPATEAAAFQETLRFVTANGGTGTLDLAGDRVTISG